MSEVITVLLGVFYVLFMASATVAMLALAWHIWKDMM